MLEFLKYPKDWNPRPDKYGRQQRLGGKWRGSHSWIRYSTWAILPFIVVGLILAIPLAVL